MAEPPGAPPVKVLSIVGTGRSGSTVLAAILGEVAGFFNAGELHWVWGRSLTEQRPCGCGRPPSKCPVWSQVVERALGVAPDDQARGGGDGIVEQVRTAERELLARRNRVRLLRGGQEAQPWPALERMRAVTASLYANLVDATDARVVVDASKRPEDAAVLAGVTSIDHYVLHVVRDPRAVVFSWSRPKSSPDGSTVMKTMHPTRVVRAWLENNVGAELLRRHVPRERWFFTRYEDFVARPEQTVHQVLAFMHEDARAPFVSPDTVVLGVNHTLLGNPDRFRTGEVRIAADDRWRQLMPASRGTAVAALTLPLMLRYGYLPAIRQL